MYECPFCQRQVANKGKFEIHTRSHTGERPYVCPKCSKAFKSPANLKRHIDFHNPQKNFECSQCGMAFMLKADMQRHERSHQKDKVCPICHETIRSIHFKSHLTERHTDFFTQIVVSADGSATHPVITDQQQLKGFIRMASYDACFKVFRKFESLLSKSLEAYNIRHYLWLFDIDLSDMQAANGEHESD